VDANLVLVGEADVSFALESQDGSLKSDMMNEWRFDVPS
jgi:hypothetical protein